MTVTSGKHCDARQDDGGGKRCTITDMILGIARPLCCGTSIVRSERVEHVEVFHHFGSSHFHSSFAASCC